MDDLRQKYLDAISNAADEAALEETRLAAVGKKGEVSLKMRELGKMTPEERQVAGPALNALKDEINSALAAKKAALADALNRIQHDLILQIRSKNMLLFWAKSLIICTVFLERNLFGSPEIT